MTQRARGGNIARTTLAKPCAMLRLAAIAAGAVLASAWDVARTPPMGFNTVSVCFVSPSPAPLPNLSSHSPPFSPYAQWNLYHCSTGAVVLNNTAASLVSSGLAAAGYIYVNTDGERRRVLLYFAVNPPHPGAR